MTVEVAEESTSASRYLPITSQPSFWIYKLTSKGPKVVRLKTNAPIVEDPHRPLKATDPVFDKRLETHSAHFGKPRLGEGNDLTPRVNDLVKIGRRLAELSSGLIKLKVTEATDRKRKLRMSSE